MYGVSENLKKEYENIPGCNMDETPFTVFIIQSKLIYLNTPEGKRFINSILPQLAAVAEEREFYSFFRCSENKRRRAKFVFNNNISTAFLLDNVAEFAGEKRSKKLSLETWM